MSLLLFIHHLADQLCTNATTYVPARYSIKSVEDHQHILYGQRFSAENTFRMRMHLSKHKFWSISRKSQRNRIRHNFSERVPLVVTVRKYLSQSTCSHRIAFRDRHRTMTLFGRFNRLSAHTFVSHMEPHVMWGCTSIANVNNRTAMLMGMWSGQPHRAIWDNYL